MRKPHRAGSTLFRRGAGVTGTPGVGELRHPRRRLAGTMSKFAIPGGMASGRSSPAFDRVVERRRAVAMARHFREAEGLSNAEIADRLGRSPATIKAYFYDPTGDKAKAVKARYVGVCRGCGAYTQPRNGKGDAYAYCKACHPGAIQGRWTRERVLEAMGEWLDRYGRLPRSWSSSMWGKGRGARPGGTSGVDLSVSAPGDAAFSPYSADQDAVPRLHAAA